MINLVIELDDETFASTEEQQEFERLLLADATQAVCDLARSHAPHVSSGLFDHPWST